jgi:glycosyltransferase involved in cell wall biosynthesis
LIATWSLAVVVAGWACGWALAGRRLLVLRPAPRDTVTPAPTVSVIVPVRNEAARLPRLLELVQASQPPPHEVIVVDDGSTDGTLERLQAYGKRITLLTQQGGRQARARNLALGVARGDLVAFLDSDDRYRPGRIRAAVKAFRDDSEAALVWSDYRCIDAEGRVLEVRRWQPDERSFARELIAGNPICNATATVRRSVLDEIGGFDERVPRVCDGAAWYQIAARGHRFVHLPLPLLDYRAHGANDSLRFALMTRDRDTALISGLQAYQRFGVLAGADDLRWARGAMTRQFAFHAAALAQSELARVGPRPPGTATLGAVLERIYGALGSNASLRTLGLLQRLKNRVARRPAPSDPEAGR